VVVEHGGSGSRAAAPIARDILYEAQRRDAEREGVLGPSVRRPVRTI
jgi:penicillin-binding protein 2